VHTHDAGHVWLRETAARVGRRMFEGENIAPSS
jgi:hypothetical protein